MSRVDPSWVGSVQLELLEHERDVFVRYVFAGHDPPHHLVDHGGAIDRLGFGTASVAVVADDVEGEGPNLGLVLIGHEALDLVDEHTGSKSKPPADQLGVAAHVYEREHERRDAQVAQGLLRLSRRTWSKGCPACGLRTVGCATTPDRGRADRFGAQSVAARSNSNLRSCRRWINLSASKAWVSRLG